MKNRKLLKSIFTWSLIAICCINIFSSETNGFVEQNITDNYIEDTISTNQESNSKSNKTEIHQLEKSIIPHAQKQIYIPENYIFQYFVVYKQYTPIISFFETYVYTYADLIGIVKIVI